MTDVLLEAARESRHSPAVLKTRILGIRSGDLESWIFVYEGKDDVGVYDVWVRATCPDLRFHPLPGNGKGQVLALRENLGRSDEMLRFRVLYFVDRDFDGLRGFAPGADIYCTGWYSVENYLVQESVVKSIVDDELRCAHEGDTPRRAIALFHKLYDEFLARMSAANLRIFAARRSGLPLEPIEDRVQKYVKISLDRVSEHDEPVLIEQLIRGKKGQPVPIDVALRDEFATLDARTCHRGKFAWNFLTIWVQLLGDDRRASIPKTFDRCVRATSLAPQSLSLRSLAARCVVPDELRNFLRTAVALHQEAPNRAQPAH